ncbi:hypothetical protein TSUD_19050 [Trifolium subterraneum]|uniref:Reverse transcriptase zinc-binding domain-containing protein n=1 Tax=Trifolium subterraneum TaxID=3900 RepID=A0A2Z6N5F4_TRISU|nr:hypothetical protein TSUD_19050 [Trifolium subterraneum]
MWWLRVGGRENLEVVDRVTRCANKLQRWGKKKRIRFKEEIDECVRRMNELREQSAFVEDRSILDNALIAIEVIHALKRKTKGRRGELALKIDISKAYDKVDWGFLLGVITKMGFTDVWIRWVMMCVCSVNYSGNVAEVNELMRILHTYETASGQEVNLVKSEVFISRNMSQAAKEDLSRILGVKLVLGTGIYLGLPSMVGRSKKAIFSYIKDRIWKRINSWRGCALSKAGGGLGLGIIFVLCMTLGCVGVLIDGCPRLNQQDVAEKILETPLVSSVREDKLVWEEERNECYSVKSGYKLAMRYIIGSDKYHVVGKKSWNDIWKAQAPHKARHLLWCLCRGCLPTRSRLLERRVECTLNCPVCDEEIEDELHIFFRCAVARDSWSAAGLSSILHNATYQQTNAMDRIFAVCINESSDTVGRVAMLLWCIWHNRTLVGFCFRDNSGHFMAGMTQWQQTVISSVEGEGWALLLAMEEARHRGLDRVQF